MANPFKGFGDLALGLVVFAMIVTAGYIALGQFFGLDIATGDGNITAAKVAIYGGLTVLIGFIGLLVVLKLFPNIIKSINMFGGGKGR